MGLKDFDPKYSIDTSKKSFRVEFYQQSRFCGMVLVHFK
ncbi:M99 family metallo-carboxypeptidase C-terminal domain-containing protein [Sulfuricurvum sp.]|nr:M99 family metallo-carboxypeptidase C-terminal domain-containing protein [Sulfuricurvum sp.]MDD3597267.1 M99 family metallo-carboxypeptidase C-terminal domain-containing protein [Sulfuricurvum sp.]